MIWCVVLLTRAYQLSIDGNPTKLDTARYTYKRHLHFVNAWVGPLFFNGNRAVSTAGLGGLANQAQHKARGIIRALRATQAETGDKANVPEIRQVGCPARIEAAKDTSFDYWLRVSSQWGGPVIELPAHSHRKLNEALRDGWQLNPTAEFFRDRNGRFYARVFVQKEVMRAEPQLNCLGVDVGYRHGACRSDGYIGTNTGRAIRDARKKQASRQRQGLNVSGTKTRMKQLLDREAKWAIARCESRSLSLAIEAPKIVGRLGRRNLHGWASAYFGHRCETLAQERGVWLVGVNPSYSSQECAECSHRDARSRNDGLFVCTECAHRAHSDVNAARVIASRGTASVREHAIRNRKRV